MTILEDLKSGRLVVGPRDADGYAVKSYRCVWQVQLGEVDQYDQNFSPYETADFPTREEAVAHLGTVAVKQPGSGRLVPKNAPHGYCSAQVIYLETALAASPDHAAGLIALVEGMERERDEAAKAFASGAYDDACKREAGIHQHALAFTVEQFRKAEARALAAEAERDALREALAPFAGCIFNDNGDITVNFRTFTADELIAAYFAYKRARTLTEKNNG